MARPTDKNGNIVRNVDDPVDWELDDNNDLIFPLRYTTGLKAVAQALRIKVARFRGEWFVDRTKGIPWFDTENADGSFNEDGILGHPFNPIRAEAEIRAEILDTSNVLEILSVGIEFDRTTRAMTTRWTVRTTFGDTSGQVTIP